MKNLRVSSIFCRCAVALAIMLCSYDVAFSATDNSTELQAVQSLLNKVETQHTWWRHIADSGSGLKYWFPDNSSVMMINRGDLFEFDDYRYAWFGWIDLILQEPRKIHPELVSYWVKRTEDSTELGQTEKDEFADKALALVENVSFLSSWSDQLRNATKSLAEEKRRELSVLIGGVPDSERKASWRSIDELGKRKALRALVEKIFASAGIMDLPNDVVWKPVSEFLIKDVEEQRTLAVKKYDNHVDLIFSMRRAFWGAMDFPSSISVFIEQLDKMDHSLSALRIKLKEQALAPGKTPMGFLERDSDKFIDMQAEIDRVLVQLLDSPAVRDEPKWIRTVDSNYSVRLSLERREDFLKAGSWTRSLHLLANEIGLSFYLANLWNRRTSWDPHTGVLFYSPTLQQVGQNIDLINKYRERWIGNGRPPGPLYAAVEVDNQLRPVWRHGGWLLWQWTTSEDLDDLTVDGRVIESLGRRWLLPADAVSTSIKSLQDVSSANAREIIVAIDPAGTWKHLGEKMQ